MKGETSKLEKIIHLKLYKIDVEQYSQFSNYATRQMRIYKII